MTVQGLRRYLVGGLVSFILSFLLLHPFSMIIQGMTSQTFEVDFNHLAHAFEVKHLPMAFFFGLLGLVTGTVGLFLVDSLHREKERVKMLESFLSICSYCKKIRDDKGSTDKKGSWVEIEQYISRHTETDFSHGICPDCYAKVMQDLEKKKAS